MTYNLSAIGRTTLHELWEKGSTDEGVGKGSLPPFESDTILFF
jgi:hypothetical protein